MFKIKLKEDVLKKSYRGGTYHITSSNRAKTRLLYDLGHTDCQKIQRLDIPFNAGEISPLKAAYILFEEPMFFTRGVTAPAGKLAGVFSLKRFCLLLEISLDKIKSK